ncbi:putative uncharacterized protein [Acholeplasma sp. CAG:878]|nr:putative uncharacterized protein [Acholeplasma sp. CAG:878]
MSELIEEYRKLAIDNLFTVQSFATVWPTWKERIGRRISNKSVNELTELGANLSDIFRSTSAGRSQSAVSSGGTIWENLVCWYLNLCSIGTRTVVVRPVVNLLPQTIKDAITVNYGSFISNTEADIVAITFPDDSESQYIEEEGASILTNINNFITQNFDKIEINIIQCKTNWNDNAQIPMLWDMIYKVRTFENNNITIGRNNFSIKDCRRFTYSFATVPTVNTDRLTTNSVAVKRVSNLSGGVYWGNRTKSGVAQSLGELPSRVFYTNQHINPRIVLGEELRQIDTKYKYFKI